MDGTHCDLQQVQDPIHLTRLDYMIRWATPNIEDRGAHQRHIIIAHPPNDENMVGIFNCKNHTFLRKEITVNPANNGALIV